MPERVGFRCICHYCYCYHCWWQTPGSQDRRASFPYCYLRVYVFVVEMSKKGGVSDVGYETRSLALEVGYPSEKFFLLSEDDQTGIFKQGLDTVWVFL